MIMNVDILKKEGEYSPIMWCFLANWLQKKKKTKKNLHDLADCVNVLGP